MGFGSDCSSHMTSNQDLLFRKKKKESGYVVFGNNRKCMIVGVSEVSNESFKLLGFISK